MVFTLHPRQVRLLCPALSPPPVITLVWLCCLLTQVAKKLVLLYIHEGGSSPGHGTPACLASVTASVWRVCGKCVARPPASPASRQVCGECVKVR